MQMRTRQRLSKEASCQPGSHPPCPVWTALWSPGTARPQRVDLGAQVTPRGPGTSTCPLLAVPYLGCRSCQTSAGALPSASSSLLQPSETVAGGRPAWAASAMLRAPHCSELGPKAFTHLLISILSTPLAMQRSPLSLGQAGLTSAFLFPSPVPCTQQVPKLCLLHPLEDGKAVGLFPPHPQDPALRWTPPGCPLRTHAPCPCTLQTMGGLESWGPIEFQELAFWPL